MDDSCQNNGIKPFKSNLKLNSSDCEFVSFEPVKIEREYKLNVRLNDKMSI